MAAKQWPLIRQWLRKYYNESVNNFFKNLPEEIDTKGFGGKTSTKAVCLIGATDSQGIAALKRQNFDFVREELGFTNNADPVHPYIALPGESVVGDPQVQLWFLEKKSKARAEGREKHPVRARIAYRLKDESFSEAEAKRLAREIARHFAQPIFSFEKGELVFTYFDKKKAYNFQIYALDISEAKSVIAQVFKVIGDTPDWKKLHSTKSEDSFGRTTTRVMDVTVTEDLRPKTTVYFAYALAKVPPLPSDIPLVDTVGVYWNPFVLEKNPFLNENLPRKPRTRTAPLR
jgi:hypothetical protein